MSFKKRVIGIFLLLTLVIQSSVLGDIPILTVVSGKMGYSLEQLHKEKIQLPEDIPTYIKNNEGKWIDIRSGKEIDSGILPEIIYTDKYGSKIVYREKDGPIIEGAGEQVYSKIKIEDNKSGIGQVVSIEIIPDYYSKFLTFGYFQVLDENGNPLTGILNGEGENYIYPSIECDKVKIALYDYYNEKVGVTKESILKDGEEILVTNRTLEDRKPIVVENIEELQGALGSYRTIHLKKGKYDLSNIKGEGKFNNNDLDSKGGRLENIAGLTLQGEEGVELFINQGEDFVLTLQNCSNIKFKDIVIGHTQEMGGIKGGAVKLEYCNDISLDSCLIYGGGSSGLDVYGTDNLSLIDSVIEECEYEIFAFRDSRDILLENCIFRNNKNIHGSVISFSHNVNIKNCSFHNNREFNEMFTTEYIENDEITIENCEFSKNSDEE